MGVVGRVAHNPLLLRVVTAYFLFTLTEYAVWIGVLVYAYDHGGATVAGLVALAELAPSVAIAPIVASLADRHPPGRVILAGYVVQAVATGLLAVAVAGVASPFPAYAAAVVASTAVATIRPAQSAVVPALIRDVSELTAANVLLGWMESLSMVLAGLATGLALTVGGVAAIFAGSAVALAAAALLVASLTVRGSGAQDSAGNVLADVRQGITAVGASGSTRALVGLLGAEYVFIGALDVLFVVVAVDLLHRGEAWTGYLNTAYGAGGVLLGCFATLLVGRRLGPVICLSALMLGLGLAATALLNGPVPVVVLLGIVGGGRAIFDVATRALLQRAVPAQMVARVFGLAEALSMAGLALGSLLTPLLVAVGGGRLALAGVGAVLPLLVLLRGRLVMRLDDNARVPIVDRPAAFDSTVPAHALPGAGRRRPRPRAR